MTTPSDSADSWVVIREGRAGALQEVQKSLGVAGIVSRIVPPPGCDPNG